MVILGILITFVRSGTEQIAHLSGVHLLTKNTPTLATLFRKSGEKTVNLFCHELRRAESHSGASNLACCAECLRKLKGTVRRN
jgi:hypothetical protein